MGTRDQGLHERGEALALVSRAVAEAHAGRGCCVMLCGEAGVGKTAVVEAALRVDAGAAHWLRSGCDALHTPRPLGPLVDLSSAFPDALARALHAGKTYNGLFPALLDWLRGAVPPRVLVIEDLHWADEATLDCVRYLGRRLADAGFVLLLTLRADQLEEQAPLRQTLAALDSKATTRIELEPLSPGAVAALAQQFGRSADGLYALTGGNPFYLQQLLRAPTGALPGSLRDAVLAQADALAPQVRAAIETAACSPGGLELEHLLALHPQALPGLDSPGARALVSARPPWLSFRHELARRVFEDALPPLRRWQLHCALLHRLQARPIRPGWRARLVHHAAAAGLSAEVWALARPAASEAESVAAYRSAVRLMQLALEHGADAPADERAALLDRLALRLHNIQAAEASAAALREAVTLKQQLGDTLGSAISLAQLALQLTPDPQAIVLAQQAVDALAGRHDNAAAGAAFSALAIALANGGRAAEALQHAQQALCSAEASGDPDSLANVGSIAASVALSVAPTPAAFDRLAACIDAAIAVGRPDRAAVPMVNLASVALAHGEYARVLAVTERGIAYCAARDLDLVLAHLQVRRALALGELSRWSDMTATLDALHGLPSVPTRQLASAAILRARLEALCGGANLAEAWQAHVDTVLQGRSDLLPAFVLVYAAEAAWLRGDGEATRRLALQGLAHAEGAWLQGQMRKWLRRAGEALPPAAETLAIPHQAAEAGDWRGAADAWLALGCRLDAALALLEGDAGALREALSWLTDLGAANVLAIARRPLLAAGVRGPYGHARRDPQGLTRRERQIAEWLAQGLSNPEIAARVHRSERTVAHHVSALLAKLGVSTRAQVASRLLPVGKSEPI